jgi:hypothetical protein
MAHIKRSGHGLYKTKPNWRVSTSKSDDSPIIPTERFREESVKVGIKLVFTTTTTTYDDVRQPV